MTKIIQRHDTSANWTAANPVLAAGEMGVETDTNKFKFGDGVTAWSGLAYAAGEGAASGSGTTLTSADGGTTYSKLALGDTLAVADGVLNANLDELGNEVNTLASAVSTNEDNIAKLQNSKQDIIQSGESISLKLFYPDAIDNLYLQVDNTYYDNPTSTTLITNPASYTFNTYGSVQMVSDSNANNSRSWEFIARLPYSVTTAGIGTYCSKSHGWHGTKNNIGIYALSNTVCTIQANGVSINVDYTTLGLSTPPSYVYFKLVQVANENTVEMFYSFDDSKYISAGSYTRNSYHHGVFINVNAQPTIDLTQCKFQFTPARDPYYIVDGVPASTTSLGVVQPDGTSITVSETGVISAVGGVQSETIHSMVVMTQAEYDALETKDATALYLIREETV